MGLKLQRKDYALSYKLPVMLRLCAEVDSRPKLEAVRAIRVGPQIEPEPLADSTPVIAHTPPPAEGLNAFTSHRDQQPSVCMLAIASMYS
jgi:hypothetical protein